MNEDRPTRLEAERDEAELAAERAENVGDEPDPEWIAEAERRQREIDKRFEVTEH